jgi:hypothetical protein
MLSFRDRWDGALESLNNTLQETAGKESELRALLDEYRTALMGSSSGDGTAQFGEHSSLRDFLLEVQKNWSGVVVSEREALEQAIHHYKEAFANGRDIAAGNQQIQASYLIAELSRRIGDHDGAKQYFTSTIKAGQEFIYQNRRDQSRTVLARKILELAIEQGRANLAAAKTA